MALSQLGQRSFNLVNGASQQLGPVNFDSQLAVLQVVIQRPTTAVPLAGFDDSTTIRIHLVIEVDGVTSEATFQATGGVKVNAHGTEFTNYTGTWQLPVGFFGTEVVRRIGQNAATFRGWATIECLSGHFQNSVQLWGESLPTPNWQPHHSVSFDQATQAYEEGGDGTQSVSITAAGSNRACVTFSPGESENGRNGATYGGNSPTFGTVNGDGVKCLLHGVSSFTLMEAYGWIDSEMGSGAKTVQLIGGNVESGLLVCTFTGVDQTTPFGDTDVLNDDDNGTPSLTLSPVTSDDMIVDGFFHWFEVGTYDVDGKEGANQTQRTKFEGSNNATALTTQSGADGGVMSFTAISDNKEWAYGAVVVLAAAVTLTREQEGFRFRNDDGSESTATWLASQDTNISRGKLAPARIRMLTNTTGDAPSEGIKLQYRKVGDPNWRDMA